MSFKNTKVAVAQRRCEILTRRSLKKTEPILNTNVHYLVRGNLFYVYIITCERVQHERGVRQKSKNNCRRSRAPKAVTCNDNASGPTTGPGTFPISRWADPRQIRNTRLGEAIRAAACVWEGGGGIGTVKVRGSFSRAWFSLALSPHVTVCPSYTSLAPTPGNITITITERTRRQRRRRRGRWRPGGCGRVAEALETFGDRRGATERRGPMGGPSARDPPGWRPRGGAARHDGVTPAVRGVTPAAARARTCYPARRPSRLARRTQCPSRCRAVKHRVPAFATFAAAAAFVFIPSSHRSHTHTQPPPCPYPPLRPGRRRTSRRPVPRSVPERSS